MLAAPALALAACEPVPPPAPESYAAPGVAGVYFPVRDPEPPAAVLSLGGAMGGLWSGPARALAEAGVPTLALATHNYPGLPPKLREIAVDPVEDAAAWLRDRARPKSGCVVARGWSRGAELALILASCTTSVDAVLAYSARCYVALEHMKPNNFGDPTAAPAWLRKGKPVAGVPMASSLVADASSPTLEELHGMPIETFGGLVLLVCGASDTDLAGTTPFYSASTLLRRLKSISRGDLARVLSYPDAGHNIGGAPPFDEEPMGGGTRAGDAAAVSDSWPKSLAFIHAAGRRGRAI